MKSEKRQLLETLAYCRRHKLILNMSERETEIYLSMLTPWKRFWVQVIWGGNMVADLMLFRRAR